MTPQKNAIFGDSSPMTFPEEEMATTNKNMPIDPEIQTAQHPSLPRRDNEKTPTSKITATTKQKAPRKRRITKHRRVIPSVKTYIPEPEPTGLDVVRDRGGRRSRGPGARTYWREMLNRRSTYRACKTDAEKNKIAQQVVDFVHGRGGRYVQRDPETNRWFILPDEIALAMVKRGLRNGCVRFRGKEGRSNNNDGNPGAKAHTTKNQTKKAHDTEKAGQEQRAAFESGSDDTNGSALSLPLPHPSDEISVGHSAPCSPFGGPLSPLSSLLDSLVAGGSLYDPNEPSNTSNSLPERTGVWPGWDVDWDEIFAGNTKRQHASSPASGGTG